MNQSSLPETIRVLPVVVIRNPEDTIPTLQALEEGGIPAAEITFRTPCAAEAIRLGVRHFPRMYIGAGTVINAAQAQQALEAGAAFLVSDVYKRQAIKQTRRPCGFSASSSTCRLGVSKQCAAGYRAM